MKREAGKVFLATAIGAFIGSLVALEANQMFWWIGLLVGGIVGYLSYEWRAVLRAIPVAYRAARRFSLHPYYWGNLKEATSFFFCIASWAYLLLMLLMILPQSSLSEAVVSATVGGFILWFGPSMIAALLLLSHDNCYDPRLINTRLPRNSLSMSLPVVLFWHLPLLFWHLSRGIMALPGFARRFAWQLFLRIHSEMRLICGVDAALGTGIGYFVGSALIGAIAGGVLGVINYLVVTEGWLKPKGYLPVRLS